MSTPEAKSLTLEEYLAGIEVLQKTEGWKTHQDIERLGWSFYIFQENYNDLLKVLQINYVAFFVRFDVRNRAELQAFSQRGNA
jgi:hypothetical protein